MINHISPLLRVTLLLELHPPVNQHYRSPHTHRLTKPLGVKFEAFQTKTLQHLPCPARRVNTITPRLLNHPHSILPQRLAIHLIARLQMTFFYIVFSIKIGVFKRPHTLKPNDFLFEVSQSQPRPRSLARGNRVKEPTSVTRKTSTQAPQSQCLNSTPRFSIHPFDGHEFRVLAYSLRHEDKRSTNRREEA